MSKKRQAPKVPLSPRTEGYGEVLASGFDTVEETFDLELEPNILTRLESAKAKAQDRGDDEIEPIRIGVENFQVQPYGGPGGVKYILRSEDFLLRIRTGRDWPVSVRYLSGAIWRDGIDHLRGRIHQIMQIMGGGIDAESGEIVKAIKLRDALKRIDWAIDIYAPEFTEEMSWQMMAGVVCHSSSKVFPVGTSARLETITIGSKKSMQVQVYDKGKEITEVSGKSWMTTLWRRNENYRINIYRDDKRPEHVWRIETRFAKEYLRDRGIARFEDVRDRLDQMVIEALFTHRLADLAGAGAKAQARDLPLHPLWSLAVELTDCREMPELGRVFTEKREVLQLMMLNQASGCLRALSVLEKNNFEPVDAASLAGRLGKRLDRIAEDQSAVEKLRERYRFLDGMT